MAKVLVEVPDDLINWTEWARRQLAQGGLANTVESAASTTPPNQADSPASSAEDPWAGTNAQPAPQNGQGDPWGSAARPTGNGAPQEPPATPPAYGTFRLANRDGAIRTAVFGKQGAPPCNHGQPAVYTEFPSGKHNWACALSQTKRWKDKCDFVQWS